MQPTDEVTLLYSDLEFINGVMNQVESYLVANDLADQYRKLDNRNRRSPLTNSVTNCLNKLEVLMTPAEDEDSDG